MEEIDRPFRPQWDFLVVWAFLTLGAVLYQVIYHGRYIDEGDPWWSKIAFLIVVPLIATFFVYGPILFIRQIVRSGARGRFVFRAWLTVCVSIAIAAAVLYWSGIYSDFGPFYMGIVLWIGLFHFLIRPTPSANRPAGKRAKIIRSYPKTRHG
jgi:hypothetical protein